MTKDINPLLDNLHKKFQTTMIGALARFEEGFGYLWEDEHPERERFENLWDDIRNSILNNGNKQARSAINDILVFLDDGPKIKNSYQYKINFNKNNQGDSYEN